jgi:hypothetical protein
VAAPHDPDSLTNHEKDFDLTVTIVPDKPV